MSVLRQIIPDGYKDTEVGILPNDWSLLALDDVCSFVGGAQPEKKFFSYKEQSGYIRLIQIRDYKSDKDIVYIPEKLARKKCSSTDIMIGRYGPPIFQILRGIEGAYNVALIKASPKEKIEIEFLYYFLKNDSLFELMDMLSQRSSGQTGVELSALKSYLIGLPCKKEQTAIANAISDVDALLTELEKLIAKKQAIKTATMQQLLTGKTRLPEFAYYKDGDKQGQPIGTKPSELGEIPEDWGVEAFGQVMCIRHGKDQKAIQVSDGFYPIFGTGGKIGTTNVPLYDKPSVMIGRKGTINKPRYADTPFWTVDTLFYSEISPRAEPKFLFYKFCMIDWMQYNEASGVPSLNASTIENVRVCFPSTGEQTAIAIILSDMDNEIQALQQRLQKTRQIKQGMMQELLTGRTRLPFDAPSEKSTEIIDAN